MQGRQAGKTALEVAGALLGQEIRRLRLAAGLKQRGLAERVHYSRSYIAVIETGRERPSLEAMERIEQALEDDGTLHALYLETVALGRPDDTGPQVLRSSSVFVEHPVYARTNDLPPDQLTTGDNRPSTGDLMVASGESSTHFLGEVSSPALSALVVEQLDADVERISVDYLTSSPRIVLVDAMSLRHNVYRALIASNHPSELKALHLAHGRLSGILAYVALDLNDGYTAMAHTRAALLSAQVVGDHALAAWVRGTQSLIARFQGRFREALAFARAGRALDAGGTSITRLWCAEAQCLAQLGNTRGTLDALTAARDASQGMDAATMEYGIFGFPSSKMPYYAGSSLIWLPNRQYAQMAVEELGGAIALFSKERPEVHSPADHVLAHIYQSTAYLLTNDLDAAQLALRTVFQTPRQSVVSWHAHRLDRVHSLLSGEHYRHSPIARSLAAEIQSFSSASLKSLDSLSEGKS